MKSRLRLFCQTAKMSRSLSFEDAEDFDGSHEIDMVFSRDELGLGLVLHYRELHAIADLRCTLPRLSLGRRGCFSRRTQQLPNFAERGSMVVKGFEKGPEGQELVCEASGKVQEGDVLVAVNGSRTAGFLHAQVVGMIKNSSNPINMTFLRKGQKVFLARFFGVPIPFEDSLRLRRVNKHCAETERLNGSRKTLLRCFACELCSPLSTLLCSPFFSIPLRKVKNRHQRAPIRTQSQTRISTHSHTHM